MILKGFGFSGYRSFGNDLTKIAPLQKVNLIIGKNNIGKSNIVKFLSEQYEYFVIKARNVRQIGNKIQVDPFNQLDKHIGESNVVHRISFPLLPDEIEDHIHSRLPDSHAAREIAKKLITSSYLTDEKGIFWSTFVSHTYNGDFHFEFDEQEISKILLRQEWQQLWGALKGSSGGNLSNWIPESIKSLSYIPKDVPKIEVIPAIRKIGQSGSEPSNYSGEGIIERIAKIQNPSLEEQANKNKFRSINTFIQDVLENSTAEIEVPHKRDMILIHMDNKVLPLESLGTGVHEVVILAAAATLLENTILCIEEPELHLHPLLQKKLINYLAKNTKNQYFITTHSAHLLDAVESEIFHVRQFNGISKVSAVASNKEKSSICNELGYKASDILQTNCIIWVEGPSDRIYLNYWIASLNKNLIEGIHYSIMFYGGKLFSHLTALDDEEIESTVEDFIKLRNLNRNAVIIFDSDKVSPYSHLNQTKKRLKEEFNKGPGFAWVTKGREIENYLDHDKLEESVRAIHRSAAQLVNKGMWVNLLLYKKTKGSETITANKVKVAKHYIKNNPVDLLSLDLKAQIAKLCNFIQTVN